MAEPRFRKNDLVDVVLRQAVVREVHADGRLSLIHSDEEFDAFSPDAKDVEVTVVGHITFDPPEPDPMAGVRFVLHSREAE